MFKRKTNVDRQGSMPQLNGRYLAEPFCFSMYTTFNIIVNIEPTCHKCRRSPEEQSCECPRSPGTVQHQISCIGKGEWSNKLREIRKHTDILEIIRLLILCH
jgi:hypothetical protein